MAATITQTSKPLHPRALDTSGNNNHGTAYTGQALEFDGVGDYITMPLDLLDGATAVSISLWFNTTESNSGMIAKYASSSIYAWWINVEGGKLTANINANKSATSDLTSTMDVNDGNWHYATLTWSYSSGLASLYLDGVLIDTDANTNETDLRNGSLNNTIGFQGYISSGTLNEQGAGFHQGLLSNVQIWDTVLTASDVAYTYANPEKLALDNPLKSIPMLTYSNLKLWYPMNDSTRGQQINVMDGSNTGKHVIGTSDGGTFTGSNPSIYPVDANGNYVYKVVGQAYEYTWTITESTSGTGVKVFPESSTYVNAVGTYTETWVATTDDRLRLYVHGFVGKISNISVSAVNLKNHGTSTFYGEELWANDEALLSTDYGSELADLSDFSSTVGVTVDGSTIVFDADTSTGAQTKLSPISYNMGSYYKVTYTISGYSGSGNFRISVGNNLGTSRTANGTYTDVLLRSAGGDSTYFYASNSLTCVLSSLSIVEVGSASELRTGSEIASGALTYNKWYEITDQGSSADLLAKGNPIDDNGDWTAQTGWAADAGNAKLTASGTTGLISADCTTSFANGDYLTITYTVTNVSGGTVRFIIGGNTNGTSRDANGTYTESVTVASKVNDKLYFDGGTAFTGEISAITVTKSVDFTLFGAPDNTIGTKFLVSHTDGSSVPTMDSDNKAWLLDLGWGGYAGNTYSITEEDDALRVKITQGSTVTNGLYIYFSSAKTEFGTAFAVGREYKFTCKLKVSSGDDVNAQIYDGASATSLGTYDDTTFVTVNSTFTAKHATNAYFKLQSLSAGDEVWISDFSIVEQGVATGWTEADAQPTIPQLGFQSYNQLGWLDGVAGYVSMGSPSTLDNMNDGGGTFSAWIFANGLGETTYPYVFWKNDKHKIRLSNLSGDAVKVHFHYKWDGDDGSWYTDDTVINFGKWHHLAITYDADSASNNPLIFIDGVSVGITDSTPSGTREDDASSNFIIGGDGGGGDSFEGVITEISVFDKELSIAEVQELYNDGEALDATLHSSVANLVGYWRNEGGDTWADLSTNSNNGTTSGVTEYLTLPEGNNSRDTQGFLMTRNRVGLNLSGVGNYIKVPINHTFGTNDFSYGFWFKIQDGQGMYMAGVQTIGHAGGVGLTMDAGNGKIRSRPFGATAVYTSAAYDDNAWHYAHHNIDRSGNAILYIDGDTAVLTQDISSDSGDSLSTDSWYIGAENGTGNYFDGMIDDFNVYSSLLTTSEITRNYKAGKARHRN